MISFFNIEESSAINPIQKDLIIKTQFLHLNADCIRATEAEELSKYKNRKFALELMANLLNEGLTLLTHPRKTTKPKIANKVKSGRK